MGTQYFIRVAQTDENGAVGSLKLSQMRKVKFMANAVSTKLQFTYDRELVKYAIFKLPASWSTYSITSIVCEKLSSHVYPTLYLKKIELENEPEKFESLDYPSIVDYDLVFGENFSTILNEEKVSRLNQVLCLGLLIK